MKKALTILTILFCYVNSNKAQYVALKDTAVMRYFKQLCPTCFKGDSLNTILFKTATEQPTITSVDISNRGVKDLSDFQYFYWGGHNTNPPYIYNRCVSFDCSHNSITSLKPILVKNGSIDPLILF